MIKIYKTNAEENPIIEEKQEIERNCWINVIKPTQEEIELLSKSIGISEMDLAR